MLNSSINIGSTPIGDLDRISGVNRAMNSAIPTVDRKVYNGTILEVNIKDEKAREKDKMLELISQRQKETLLPMPPQKDLKKISIEETIEKLKTILSKRFNLEEDDYKILVDRYHITQNGITKSNLEEMITYIKQISQFGPKKTNIASGHIDIAIKEPSKPMTDYDKLEEERRIQIETMKNAMAKKQNNNDVNLSEMTDTIVNMIGDPISPIEMQILKPLIDTKTIVKNKNSIDELDPIVFILNLDHITSSREGIYEIPLWIEDQDRLRNISKCKIVSLELDREFYSKHLDNIPYIFVDIVECKGSIYINGTTKKLVDRLRLERLEKIYYGEGWKTSLIKETFKETIKKLSIAIYNNKCELLLLEKGPITITIEFS